MAEEDKELLLKDLCIRLPYKTEIQVNDYAILTTTLKVGHISRLLNENLEIKPYLFPMSSMTEEQKKEFKEISKCEDEIRDFSGFDSEGVYLIEIGKYEYEYDIDTTVEQFYFNHEIIDWLNKNHFDYRGLIPKELAIDATGLDIYL